MARRTSSKKNQALTNSVPASLLPEAPATDEAPGSPFPTNMDSAPFRGSDQDITDISDLLPDDSAEDDNEVIGDWEEDEVISSIMECRREAADARYMRMRQNNINRDAYMGLQDWSHKQQGQSSEFLPKTSSAVEQFTAFIKKSLVGFGDWFGVTLSEEIKPYVTDGQIRELLKYFLGQLPDGYNKTKTIESVLADGGKVGLLESITVFKIYGRDVSMNEFYVEPGADIFDFNTGQKTPTKPRLKRRKSEKWHLAIDLIRDEDYYPDPTGRGLYEIHEVERDYIDVLELAKQGVYDLDIVEQFKDEDMAKPYGVLENRRPQQLGQNRTVSPGFRKRCVLTEYWGVLLGEDGRIIGRNVVCTIANKKYMIRKPMVNPFWHGESPFISHPLIRVPFSTLHKALYDSASFLNFAMNETFNLMLDGGISSVWGIKQLRVDHLADPKQVEGGIGQGVTLHVKDSLPSDQKVLEMVASGELPPSAMQLFEMLNSEFNEAALTNELKLGGLPPTGTKATAIMTVEQNQSITLASLTMDMERNQMEPMLRKSWLTILQHLGDIDLDTLKNIIGKRAAAMIAMMSDAERFVVFANSASFKVSGLTATLARAQDFQKLMAFIQAASQNPILARSLLTNYSPDRLLKMMMKLLNINPDDLANTPDENANVPQLVAQIQMFAQMFGGANGQQGQGTQDGQGGMGPAGPTQPPNPGMLSTLPGQNPAMAAGVNQQLQPLTGLKTV